MQQVGTLRQGEVQALQQQVQALHQQLHSPQQQLQGCDAEAVELAAELRTEVRLKRKFVELERQRTLEDKFLKVIDLLAKNRGTRFQSP